MNTTEREQSFRPTSAIHLVEAGVRSRKNWRQCQIGKDVRFSTNSLESYFFSDWKPLAYEALLLAGAIEFADRVQRRPALSWQREITLRVPVSDPDLWNAKAVCTTLHDAICFLTGDIWRIEFYRRAKPPSQPRQGRLSLGSENISAVLPFSNGMDSLAVAGLAEKEFGSALVRVRLGSRDRDREKVDRQRHPFTAVPYRIKQGKDKFVETTARSRGFKYALVSGLAAYMANAKEVIVPESGQGALGPALLAVGQSYPDYRSHPFFTQRMEKFLKALLDHQVHYSFPRLWMTKAETLREFITACADSQKWTETWSCWQQNRHSSVAGTRRHCGICAACMLRRLSVHAAGQSERIDWYVWEDLRASHFADGAAVGFKKKLITEAMREYAIAGTLHLDHLAGLQNSRLSAGALRLHTVQLSRALGISEADAHAKMSGFLARHRREWKDFVVSLGDDSFISEWALSAQS